MVEKIKGSGIESAANAESLELSGKERAAEIEQSLERLEQNQTAENLDEVRNEALELAQEKSPEPIAEKVETQEVKHTSRPTKKQLNDNFDRSMANIRKDMKPASRAFSKVIHNKVVEKTSDVVASTVARPNLIIAGGLSTLILCSAVYLIAKQYGYVLSGFEAIGTFILGWGIGAIIEFARVGFINQKNIEDNNNQ